MRIFQRQHVRQRDQRLPGPRTARP
jgi:hypothetical protein